MLRRLLDRPVAVTMAVLTALVLGIVSMRLLPVSLIPDVEIPFITVQAVSSGLSAREMDESVVGNLRQHFIQVNGLQDIRCESRDGVGVIRLSFSHGTDMDYAFVEVNEKVDRCMSSLPEIERPEVIKAGAADIPACYLNLTLKEYSESGFRKMSRFAEDVISKRLEQQETVAMVDISGHVDEQILIVPRKEMLVRLGMTHSQFEAVLKESNVTLGNLTIADGQYRYNVKFMSSLDDCDDIAQLCFRHGGRIYKVGDIADVTRQSVRITGLVRSDSSRAVSLAVIKQSDARMSDLRSTIKRLIDSFSEDYPEICFTVTRDQTRLLDYSINNLLENIVIGIILSCLVIFLFMRDLRSPTLVSLTMPLSLVFSMAVFHIIGLSINIISLSGLLLGVGLMADNTIILVDNVTSVWQRGRSLKDAVIEGTREVAAPMLSSLLTTCAVFIPLVFISGIAGDLFYDQAMAVTIVLMTSYIVTLTVIPVYYYLWYRKYDSFRPHPLLGHISFDEPLRRWNERLARWFMDHRWLSWGILTGSLVGVAVCLIFMKREKLPEMTHAETIMTIDWNSQISVEENEVRTAVLENMIEDKALQMTSFVGMQRFVLDHSDDLGISGISMYISCKDVWTLESVKNLLSDELTTNYPSATYSFAVSGNIFDAVFGDEESMLTARIRPVSAPQLKIESLELLLSELRQNLPGQDIGAVPAKTDALFIADREKMLLYDVSVHDLMLLLKTALNENILFTIVQGSATLPVVTGTGVGNLSEILSETFMDSSKGKIPVSEVMRQTFVRDFKTIVASSEGNYYPVSLSSGSKDVPEIMTAVDEIVRENGDYEVSYSGAWFSNRKMIGEMLLVLLVAVILLYLILASQFESLVQPLIILSEIVIDIFASLLVLWIHGISVNLMSLIGMVVISGIVINDSILKIDTVNRLRREGMGLREALIEGGGRRMKSIIMTSMTTILAVCPFLSRGNMGDSLQYPMSVVIIAGMTVGTLVSLFVLPSLYYSVYRRRDER